MEHNEQSTPDDGLQPGSGASGSPPSRVSAGRLLREAREKAGIPAAKVSADLRIAPATLAALEAGDYGKLAGPPYVRAMLVSLSRYLHLESRDILKAYSEEAGDTDTTGPTTISPYKDDSGTHAKAHKQIFILVLAVLLLVLLLIMGKVNTSSPEPEPVEPPVPADTLLNIAPPLDTGHATLPGDSALVTDSVALPALDSVQADTNAGAEAEEPPQTNVRIIALSDSIWLRVLPAGTRESSLYLRVDRPVDFTHDETITFITRRGGTVRVIAGDQEEIPPGRRFKVDGDQITY